MLTCGHCFCNECTAIIIEQYSVGTRRSSIKCAICRQTTSHKEISYVFTAETANQEDDIPVKVRCLCELCGPNFQHCIFVVFCGILHLGNLPFSFISRFTFAISFVYNRYSSFSFELDMMYIGLPYSVMNVFASFPKEGYMFSCQVKGFLFGLGVFLTSHNF